MKFSRNMNDPFHWGHRMGLLGFMRLMRLMHPMHLARGWRAGWLVLSLAGTLVWAGARPLPERPIDLNLATRTELMQLPRVGPRTADRIIAFRQAHGPFQRVEEIMEVRGLGEKAFLRLKPFIKVSPP